jgi:hypothetical protein
MRSEPRVGEGNMRDGSEQGSVAPDLLLRVEWTLYTGATTGEGDSGPGRHPQAPPSGRRHSARQSSGPLPRFARTHG